MGWFVSGRKYRALQAASGKMYKQIMDAHREMERTDGHMDRTALSLAHRIHLHRDETRFQPQADASGKTYTWVCTSDDLTSLFAAVVPAGGGIPEAPTFHQHSVQPRLRV